MTPCTKKNLRMSSVLFVELYFVYKLLWVVRPGCMIICVELLEVC